MAGLAPAIVVEDAYIVGKEGESNLVEMRIPWEAIGIKDTTKADFRLRIVDGSPGLDPLKGDWLPDITKAAIITEAYEGAPEWNDDGSSIKIKCDNFGFSVEKSSGKVSAYEGMQTVPMVRLPGPFFNRAEVMNMLSPFRPQGVPYSEYPDESTRKISSINVREDEKAISLVISEEYKDIRGTCEILLDRKGAAKVIYDYEYTGEPFAVSEVGIRFWMNSQCDEIKWRRDSEWDVYPEGHIGRTEGKAKARREGSKGAIDYPPYLSKPAWPWSLDENNRGTREFRSIKHHIYNAEIVSSDSSGIRVISDGTTTDVRASLSQEGVEFKILNGEKPAITLNGGFCLRPSKAIPKGHQLKGSFIIQFLASSRK